MDAIKKVVVISAFFLFLFQNDLHSAEQTIRRPTQFILKDFILKHQDSGQVSSYIDFLKSQGYTGVDMEVLDRQNNFYINSRYLTKMKWTPQPNILTQFLKEWDEKNKSLGEDALNFCVDITPLAQRQNEEENIFASLLKKINVDKSEEFFIDLQASYLYESATSEAFSDNIQSKFYKILNPAKRKVNMTVATSSFENFLRSLSFNRGKLERYFHRLVTMDSQVYPLNRDFEDNLPTIGLGDFAFALGKSMKKEVWAGVFSSGGQICDHNLFLYRTVQYSPQGYVLAPDDMNASIYNPGIFNFEKAVKQDVAKFYAISKTKLRKPLCNLVIASCGKRFQEPYIAQFIEPVMNAILSNGYDIQVTFEHLYKKADLYYVITLDDKPSDLFMDELLRLMDLRRSHFYGTVILHPMHEIVNSGRWKKVREFFHIPNTEKGWMNDIPSNVRIGGHKYLWKGTVNGNSYGMSYIRESAVRSSEGEVFLPEVFQNNTMALIIKSEKHFLINGNFLHLEASYFLSQLMGNALQAPFTGYVTSNRSCTAVLAVADSLLKIKIPSPENSDRWRCIIYNEKGHLSQDALIQGEKIFEKQLQANHLLILETR